MPTRDPPTRLAGHLVPRITPHNVPDYLEREHSIVTDILQYPSGFLVKCRRILWTHAFPGETAARMIMLDIIFDRLHKWDWSSIPLAYLVKQAMSLPCFKHVVWLIFWIGRVAWNNLLERLKPGIRQCVALHECEVSSWDEYIAKARQHNIPIHPMHALSRRHERIRRIKRHLLYPPM